LSFEFQVFRSAYSPPSRPIRSFQLPLCCILVSDLVDWGFMVEVPPRVFLAVRVCLCGFVGNPGITYESFVSLF
jgi:hypothetical protein